MSIEKVFIELVSKIISETNHQRILFKSKFIDELNFGTQNILYNKNYNFIIISAKYRNNLLELNLDEIQYTANFGDLMYYRNSPIEEFKKFVALIPENWVVLDSIQEAAFVVENLEFEMIKHFLLNGSIIFDYTEVEEILKIFSEYGISFNNFIELLSSNSLNDIKKHSRIFDKFSFNETKKTLNKALQLLEFNQTEFQEIKNSKSQEQSEVLEILRNDLIANFNPKLGFQNSVFESASVDSIFTKLHDLDKIDFNEDINKKIIISDLESLDAIGTNYIASKYELGIEFTKPDLINNISVFLNGVEITEIQSQFQLILNKSLPTHTLSFVTNHSNWKRELKIFTFFNGIKLRFINGKKIIPGKYQIEKNKHFFEVDKIDFNKDVIFEIFSFEQIELSTEFEGAINQIKLDNLYKYSISGFNSNNFENINFIIHKKNESDEFLELKITPSDLKFKIQNYSDEIEKYRIRQSGFTGELRFLLNKDPLDNYWQELIHSEIKVCFLSLNELEYKSDYSINEFYIKSTNVDLGITETKYSFSNSQSQPHSDEYINNFIKSREKTLEIFRKAGNFVKIRRDLLSLLKSIDQSLIIEYIESYYSLIRHAPQFSNIDTIYLLKPDSESNRRLGQHNICGSILPFFHPVCIQYYYNYSKLISDQNNPNLLQCRPKLIDHYKGQENEIFTRVENNSHLYSLYIGSNNGNFRTNHHKISESIRKHDLFTIDDNIVLGHSDIIKALDSLFSYVPFKYSYNIAILGKSDLQIEKIIGDYLNEITDLDNLDSIELRIYDYRYDTNQIDELYLGLYSLNSKFKLIWYTVKRTDFLPTNLTFDLLLDLSLEVDMTPKMDPNNELSRISTDKILTTVSQFEFVQNNKFNNIFYSNYSSDAVSYFVNKSTDKHIFIREYYNSTSVQNEIYQSSKLIATTAQGYYHISNSPTNNMLLYELHLSNKDYHFGNNGDFYLSINENKIFEDRLRIAFSSILDTVPNELETSTFLKELRDLNLFQFKYFLSNRNKTQGLIGEAWIYKNYYLALTKLYGSNFVLLPYDLIHENLFKSLNINGELKNRHHPDFLCLSFSNDTLNVQFLEVKTYFNSSPRFTEIYENQILPVQKAFNYWIEKSMSSQSSALVFKLQILHLFEICASNYGNRFKINNKCLNDWINADTFSVNIKDPIIFYISASEEFDKWSFDKVNYTNDLYYLLVKCTFSEINPKRFNTEINSLFSSLTNNNENVKLNYIKPNNTYNLSDVKDKAADSEVLNLEIENNIEDIDSITKTLGQSTHIDEKTKSEIKNKMSLVSAKMRAFKINIYPKVDLTIFGPSSIKCYFEMDPSVSINSISNKDEDIAIALMLEKGQSVIVDHEKGLCTIEFSRADSDRQFFEITDILNNFTRSKSDLVIPFGIDSQGKIISINFSSSQTPHLLIGGQTGSGKSIALKTILTAATKLYAADELNLTLIDPKRVELISFTDLPHLLNSEISTVIGSNTEDTIQYLQSAISIMEKRYELFQKFRVTNLTEYNLKTGNLLCRHLIVLDEYADIVSNENLRGELESLLERLSQKARAAGIHLILTTQKPSGKVLSTVIRSNLPAQLALKVSRLEDSRIILGEHGGAQKLNGKGDALFNNGSGSPIRLQVANS